MKHSCWLVDQLGRRFSNRSRHRNILTSQMPRELRFICYSIKRSSCSLNLSVLPPSSCSHFALSTTFSLLSSVFYFLCCGHNKKLLRNECVCVYFSLHSLAFVMGLYMYLCSDNRFDCTTYTLMLRPRSECTNNRLLSPLTSFLSARNSWCSMWPVHDFYRFGVPFLLFLFLFFSTFIRFFTFSFCILVRFSCVYIVHLFMIWHKFPKPCHLSTEQQQQQQKNIVFVIHTTDEWEELQQNAQQTLRRENQNTAQNNIAFTASGG